MTNVWALIGAPFSGKTSWTTEFLYEHSNTVIICPDEIRKELTGDINNQACNQKVFIKAHNRLEEAVECGVSNVIFDATNIAPRSRNAIFERCMFGVDVHYVIFHVTLEEALKRKANDSYRIAQGQRSDVPDMIIEKFVKEFDNNIEYISTDTRAKTITFIK